MKTPPAKQEEKEIASLHLHKTAQNCPIFRIKTAQNLPISNCGEHCTNGGLNQTSFDQIVIRNN